MLFARTITRSSPLSSFIQAISKRGSPRSIASSRLYTTNMSSLPRLPILKAIASHDPASTAVIHSVSGRRFTYGDLIQHVAEAQTNLEKTANGSSLKGERVAFLVENSYDYIDSIALPLAPSFPASELRYILNNSEARILLASDRYKSKADEVLKEGLDAAPIFSLVEKRLEGKAAESKPEFSDSSFGNSGMMLFTSGTTSRPKGVLLPESALTAQAESLVKAWKYAQSDHLLHVLPLHHIHGTINALIAPLFAGSTIEFMFPFNANNVWERFAAPFQAVDNTSSTKEKITFFTVVPTIYNRLLSTITSLPEDVQAAARQAISPDSLRLNISGSAALPTPTKTAWTELSHGNVLLERYGMTEVGMALSCGLDKNDRIDGSVGWPLPSVEARLVDTETSKVIPIEEEIDANGKEREGEIQLRGPTIFKEYWKNAAATSSEFVDAEDGKGRWFKTGDVAIRKTVPDTGTSGQEWAQGPMYFIRGRSSVDIIKTGGEKVSALEIERELLSLPQIAEAAVVALPSDQWGQKVAAIVVLAPDATGRGGKPWGVMDMRRALKDKLVNYKIPQELKVLENGIPRNAMGKINKKSLVKEVFPELMEQ